MCRYVDMVLFYERIWNLTAVRVNCIFSKSVFVERRSCKCALLNSGEQKTLTNTYTPKRRTSDSTNTHSCTYVQLADNKMCTTITAKSAIQLGVTSKKNRLVWQSRERGRSRGRVVKNLHKMDLEMKKCFLLKIQQKLSNGKILIFYACGANISGKSI